MAGYSSFGFAEHFFLLIFLLNLILILISNSNLMHFESNFFHLQIVVIYVKWEWDLEQFPWCVRVSECLCEFLWVLQTNCLEFK